MFVLKVSALKTVTSESGVKNPIQQSTFYLQRSSGARAMLGFVPTFLALYGPDISGSVRPQHFWLRTAPPFLAPYGPCSFGSLMWVQNRA